LEFGGEALVLTHDTMVEGVHFLSGQSDEDLAWKLVASNMSDLAAKGVAVVRRILYGFAFTSRYYWDRCSPAAGARPAMKRCRKSGLHRDEHLGRSNVRTAAAAQTGLQEGLTLAFRAGAITGMLVAGLALLAIAGFFWYLTGPAGTPSAAMTAPCRRPCRARLRRLADLDLRPSRRRHLHQGC
jgi:hypothetical protein